MQLNAGFFTLALAGFATIAAAQPHKHGINARHHIKPRDIVTEFVTKTVDQFGNDYKAKASVAASPKENGPRKVANKDRKSTSSQVFEFVTSTKSTPSPSASVVPDDLDPGKDSRKGASGVDSDFPDGKLDCDKFPSDYGAVPLKWVTKQGWSGIQINGGNGDSVGECKEGALCSYACPPGYSKAQWPSNQPSSGESHGGLKCKNGKLRLTRKDYPKLCQAGKGTASVVSKLNKFVAICRTDYPGSENMVVPLSCSAGSTQQLTVPDAVSSYEWRGNPSSAQYYVNNAGVNLQDGCVWGPPGGGRGNWSPVVIGAGYRGDKTWLSISQNNLNSDPLNYNIKIVADKGSKLSGECKYEHGKFSNGDKVGCTVAIDGDGSAHFELY